MAKLPRGEGVGFLVHFKRPTSKKFVARMVITPSKKSAGKSAGKSAMSAGARLERNLGLHRAVEMAIELLKICMRSGKIPSRKQRQRRATRSKQRRRAARPPDSPPRA